MVVPAREHRTCEVLGLLAPAASGTSLPHHVLCTAYGAEIRGIQAADHAGLGDAGGGVLRARV